MTAEATADERGSAPWQMRDQNYTPKAFLRDLRALEFDVHRVHDLRRAFISLAGMTAPTSTSSVAGPTNRPAT